jgi:hypothetical protein
VARLSRPGVLNMAADHSVVLAQHDLHRLRLDVPDYVPHTEESNFTHCGIVALVYHSEISALKERKPLSKEVEYFWSISLKDALQEIEGSDLDEALDKFIAHIFKDLCEQESRNFLSSYSNAEQAVREKLKINRVGDIRDCFRPNQYFRPAFKIIMQEASSSRKFSDDYHFLGAVEAANPARYYAHANFGIFGGKRESGESNMMCAFREMREELSISFGGSTGPSAHDVLEHLREDEVTAIRDVVDLQRQMRWENEVSTLPLEIKFFGKLGPKPESMNAFVIICPTTFLRDDSAVPRLVVSLGPFSFRPLRYNSADLIAKCLVSQSLRGGRETQARVSKDYRQLYVRNLPSDLTSKKLFQDSFVVRIFLL